MATSKPGVDTSIVVPRHGRMPRHHAGRKLVGYIALGLACVLVSLTGVAGFTVLQLTSNIDTVDISGGEELPSLAEQAGSFNVLLVGSDTREGQASTNDGYVGGELNDVTMMLHVSEDHKSATVVSFPRDLMIDFPACPDPEGGAELPPASYQQLNTALGRGGLGCVVEVIENLTGLDIPYAAKITFDGVVNMSTAVGGVPVCFTGPLTDVYTGLQIPSAGTFELAGEQALQFLRARHSIGDGSDLSRISSQQVFMSALARKLQSDEVLTNVASIYRIAQVATENMQMSTSLNNIGTMVAMAQVMAKIPLSTMQFVMYPNVYAGSRVVPEPVAAADLMNRLANDLPVVLGDDSLGQGSEAVATDSPESSEPGATEGTEPSVTAEPSAEPSATDPSATPDPADTPLDNVVGQSAEQQSCVVPFGY